MDREERRRDRCKHSPPPSASTQTQRQGVLTCSARQTLTHHAVSNLTPHLLNLPNAHPPPFHDRRTILSILRPFLPPQTLAFLTDLEPLLSLLTSPTQLLYTAYTSPSTFFTILRDTFSRLYTTYQTVDLSGNHAWQTALPFVIGGFGLYMAVMSVIRTFRSAGRLLAGLVRWSWLIGIVVTLLGYFMGAGNDRNGGQAQGGGVLGSVLNTLLNRGGNLPAGVDWTSQASTLFSSVFGDQNQQSSSYTPKNKQQSASSWENLKKSSSSSRKTRSQSKGKAEADPLSNLFSSFTGGGGDDNPDGLGGYAQKWVKEAVLKASGLDGLFGGTAEKEKDEGKKRKGKGGSR